MSSSIKDPDARLDYSWDWAAWLDGATIANVEVIVPDGLTLESPATSDATTRDRMALWGDGGGELSGDVPCDRFGRAC